MDRTHTQSTQHRRATGSEGGASSDRPVKASSQAKLRATLPTQLVLVGDWAPACAVIETLVHSGYQVTWAPAESPVLPGAALYLVRPDAIGALSPHLSNLSPALVWNVADDPTVALVAYQTAGTMVLPGATPVALLMQSIDRLLSQTVPRTIAPSPQAPRLRHYGRGETIRLPTDRVATVEQGILAQTVIHADGTAVLLGLLGVGQLLTPHPEDDCLIQLAAHTDATLALQSWGEASAAAEFANRLRSRLWQMEAWAAMQARPHLQDRLLGILSLLAEQFGRPAADGVLIDVRITHAQLATAIGANRTTITRLISELRRRNLISTVGHGQDERFCLRAGSAHWQSTHLA